MYKIEFFGFSAEKMVDGKTYKAHEFFREGRRGVYLEEVSN